MPNFPGGQHQGSQQLKAQFGVYEACISVHADGAQWGCYRSCWESHDSPRTEKKGHANVKFQVKRRADCPEGKN